MEPAPIMEEEEIEEEKEEMEDQEQTKKKDLQQTQKPFARVCGEESVGRRRYGTERQSAEERSRRRAWRREGEEDWAVRDESEM